MLSPHDVVGTITIEGVDFFYPTKPEVQVAKNVSITIEKNTTVAFVGQSGCGKSSLIALIERFYDPNKGRILFSGVDIKEFDARWYKTQIALVSQEPILFAGTIRENICYGLDVDSVEEADLDFACAQANVSTFLDDKQSFPLRYDTVLGERGIKLSGGQKQRVAIARALIRKPKILLLDEATSALDAESEHQVQIALDKLMKEGNITIIVIAHRLSTIRDATQIVCMERGEVMERGTHSELVARDGVYKKLVQRQLES